MFKLFYRYSSGNNNHCSGTTGIRFCAVRKSNSLPNLQAEHTDNIHATEAVSNSTIDSYGKMRTLLPMCLLPDSSSPSESPQPLQNSSSSNEPHINQPSFNLVKLFIKQKSSSSDTCMDVSSGCWPSDSSSSVEQKQRKKSMYDSGKGSALSKHDEENNEAEIQYDSLDVAVNANNNNNNQQSGMKDLPHENAPSNDLYREVFDSPSHRRYKECNFNIRNLPRHLSNVNNNSSSDRESLKDTIKSISDTSRTSDNITQVYAKTKLPLDMITRSMQTSMIKDSIKVVPPSFLAQLNASSKTNEQKQAPVYVIYPNYALPDLGFVKNHQSQIILSPLGLKESFPKKRRPMSTADIDSIKKREYKHIMDWKSLAHLLPMEYKKMLQHIPEVKNVVRDPKVSQKPLFCMSPPIRRSRPMSCDCSSVYTNSSSGSSQQPSSGYRGSSTMLTDSEFETAVNNNNLLKNLQNGFAGDSNRSDDQNSCNELPPSGYIKRGILRRTHSSQSKRNSMISEVNVNSKTNKRNSLQDPYYVPLGGETYSGIDHKPEMRRSKTHCFTNNNLQYYPESSDIFNQTKECFSIEQKEYDAEARQRVEHFLSNVPKSELKYYAEIANILESIDNISDAYDRNKLRNDVSRALAQKRVSFDRGSSHLVENNNINSKTRFGKEFTTPPNSPNISISNARGSIEQQQRNSKKTKQDKIQSNRFKRLQIQWELLSKDAQQMEKELYKETRSGGTTPTTPQTPRSRIPRPVSYPAAK